MVNTQFRRMVFPTTRISRRLYSISLTFLILFIVLLFRFLISPRTHLKEQEVVKLIDHKVNKVVSESFENEETRLDTDHVFEKGDNKETSSESENGFERDDKNNEINSEIDHGFERERNKEMNQETNQDSWTILHDSYQLRAEVESIHNASYKIKEGDKCVKSLPDVMMVGVAKCGTTELLDFMSIHPNIVSKRKPDQIPSHEFYNSYGYLRIKDQMPCRYHDQLSVLKSDSFLGEDKKPIQIHAMNPNMKIMAIIREPVERLLSDLTFKMKSMGPRTHIQNATAMKDFVRDLLNSSKDDILFQARQSMYAEGIKRYLEVFPREQILIIESNEFIKNPVNVVNRVEKFLGIKHFVTNEHFVLNPNKPFYCVRKMQENRTMVCYDERRGRPNTETIFDKADIDALRTFYKPYSEDLFRLLGQRYDW